MGGVFIAFEGAEIALKTEALLFAADRAEHMATVIHPVLGDRFTHTGSNESS